MNKGAVTAVIIVLLIIVAGFLARHQIKSMLSGSSTQPTPQVTTETATSPTPTESAMTEASGSASPSAMANMQQITVVGNEFKFNPSTLTLKKGEMVSLTFKNTGNFPHNLSIADLNAKTKTIQPGQEDTITFTPDKTGSFAYTCTVDGHAQKGMVGTVTVQ